MLRKITKHLFFCLLILSVTTPAWAQNSEITGIVKDETGQPLVGASVLLLNTKTNEKKGIMVNAEGKFQIKDLLAGVPYNISASFIGYTTKTIENYQLKAGEQATLFIQLSPEASSLNDVVIVGYASQRKGNITSAIASIKPDKIDKGANYDPVKMLQGRATGVNISSTSGTPGSNPSIMIRGVSSISGGDSPLYVVDGMPTDNLPNLNPNDIESMDVLKDASAAAIYGSRANSGVIIIKTKSGKAGKTVINYNSQFGWGTVSNDIVMANSAEYTKTMQAALANYNAQTGNNLSLYIPANIEEFNWVKAIARERSATAQHNINLSGGNDKTTFFTSLGYFKQEGYLKKSALEQYSLRMNLTHKINKYIKFNGNIAATYTPQSLLEETSTSLKILRTAREEQPWYSAYNSSGDYKVNGTQILRHNPVMLQNEETWTRKDYQGIGNFSVDITPFEGFKYTSSINTYAILSDEKKKLTENMVARATSAGWGAIEQRRNENLRFVINNIMSYDNNIGKLKYTALIGHEYWYRNFSNLGAYSDNYANNAFPSSSFDLITSGTNIYATGVGYSSYNLESYLGRLTLDYDGKYLLNASFRRDGSSKFSKDARYGNFPSASIAWRATKEDFFPKQDVLTDLKVRLSVGTTGSIDGIGNYASKSLVGAGNSYNGSSGLVLTQRAQHLTWEKATQYDAGIDAEFFKGRLSLTMDYFYQKTKNLLYNLPIYSTSGYTSIAANIGTLSNNGFELALNGKILQGEVKWDAGANISFVQNKLLSLYSNSDMYIVPGSGSNLFGGSLHALINGKSISSYYLYNMLGLYQNDADVPAPLFAKGVRAGDVQYEDINGDGDISDIDRKYVGKTVPDFYGGFNTTVSYKGFDLGIFGQFSYGGKVIASWQGINGVEGTDNPAMSPSRVYIDEARTTRAEQYFNVSQYYANNYWHGPGTSNTVPRPVRAGVFTGYRNGYNSLASTRYLQDGSYLKFKTITLGYSLSEKLIERTKFISSLRVYATVDNLLTFTNYSGYDPEASFAGSPGDPNYGVDFGLQPTLRTFSLGVNIKF
ncbi:SusC/RagA family TonB-linked outer membrane protein [Pedobacter endophyticus]|uniref:TonB-dependent receptor n=1 Tax=Pedobacter endophyticus TaxID=2789740 RepID=A0A7S9KYN6_9SPHI|nr:TonB-dependent receptor [Pedobacter endophyticus]QPH39309.1 TonB-dependent receptor [Pedobacter endophyticus]